MLAALEEADITAESISYLNTHATLTTPGDISELTAVDKVFGRQNKVNMPQNQ